MAEMAKQPHRFDQLLVHTGQHYDYNMSQVFFDQLEMPSPDEFLNVGSGTHAVQTASIMIAFEPVILKHSPDWVFVVGDVNSTFGCALVCSKLGIPVAHVEAGLRSFDRSMPEEINRLLTDQIADLLFTPSCDANENLVREGIPLNKIHFVGNVMIDTVAKLLPMALQSGTLSTLELNPREYVLVTLHRPSNVDDPEVLAVIVTALEMIADIWPVIFPVHPRTRTMLMRLNFPKPHSSLRVLDPLGYVEFLALMNSAKLVLTDSGGVQEETTYLGVPCLTVRTSTERPVTIDLGTNKLVASTGKAIAGGIEDAGRNPRTDARKPEFWDGFAARRIVEVITREDTAPCIVP